MVKVGRYNYEKSTRAGKKLMTSVRGKPVHFGDATREHYKDRTGLWSHLDHGDSKRRANYLARSAGIRDGQGGLTKDDPSSPNWHSRRILW